MTKSYRVGVDIGGTFTDLIVINQETGAFAVGKVLTTPADPSQAVETVLVETLGQAGIDLTGVQHLVHGTTLVTNAMIERKGARTALLTALPQTSQPCSITTHCATPACSRSTASTSPNSIRYPRNFTCPSSRPTNSSFPSSRHFTRSPVRYNRSPTFPLIPSGTNLSAVNAPPFTYPRASPVPATYNSPTTPGATGRNQPSSTYTRVLTTGVPMGTRSVPVASKSSVIVAKTVTSVGP